MKETRIDDDVQPGASLEFKRPTPRTVLGSLAGIFGVLLLLDVIGQLSGRQSASFVSLDSEMAIGTWWASTQLALVAVTLVLVARRESHLERRASTRALLLGAVVALYLSIDETASFHDLLAQVLDDRFPHGLGSVRGMWVIIYAIAAAIVLALAAPGIVSLVETDRADAIRFAVGLGMLMFGGVGIAIIGVLKDPYVEAIVGETFEFLGVAVMLWAAYRMLTATEFVFRRG